MGSSRFKPGQSGNPKGRPPKGLAVADILEEILDVPVGAKDRRTRMEAILEKLIGMALKGDIAAIREVLDRRFGKPLQSSQVQVQEGPTELLVTWGGDPPPAWLDDGNEDDDGGNGEADYRNRALLGNPLGAMGNRSDPPADFKPL